MAEKPMLTASLEQLSDVTQRLRVASEAYQRLKSYLGVDLRDVPTEKLPQLSLSLPGTPVAVPLSLAVLPVEELQLAVETACTAVGEDIVCLWATARKISVAADEHCQAAAQAAAQSVVQANQAS